MKRVRVGVIGVGRMGIHHARLYAEIPGAELVGVADADPASRARASATYGIPVFEDHRELLPLVDAVSIAVPTTLHHQVAGECLDRGIHVLVEKPIAHGVAEAEDLAARAVARGVVLQVGHIERFNPAVVELRRILAAEKLLAISARRCSPPTPQIFDVDVVFDLLIHDLDIALALAGSPVRSVKATGSAVKGDRIDLALVQIEFENGILADLVASKLTQLKIRELTATTENAYVTVDYISRDISIYRNASVTQAETVNAAVQHREGVLVEKPVVRPIEPLRLELEHVLGCIGGAAPLVTAADAIAALRLATAISDQLTSGAGAPLGIRGGR